MAEIKHCEQTPITDKINIIITRKSSTNPFTVFLQYFLYSEIQVLTLTRCWYLFLQCNSKSS